MQLVDSSSHNSEEGSDVTCLLHPEDLLSVRLNDEDRKPIARIHVHQDPSGCMFSDALAQYAAQRV